jgi:hypothetical protein
MVLAVLPATVAVAAEHAPEPRDTNRVCDDAEDDDNPFTDVMSSNLHYRNILCAADEALIRGYADATFRPARHIQRDQAASVIVRWVEAMAGETLEDSDVGFRDVSADNVHRDNINKLANAGIVVGHDETTYDPDGAVTRQTMAAFLHRARSYVDDGDAQNLSRPPPTEADYFADVDEDNPFFDNINALADVGIASGHDDGDFRPADPVRRDQMTSFVMRAFDYLETGPHFLVWITGPTSEAPDTVEAGEDIEVAFTTNMTVGGSYTVQLGDDDAWVDVGRGHVASADISTTATVPEDTEAGASDLRVTVENHDRTATDVEQGAVIVIGESASDASGTATSSDSGGALRVSGGR